MTYLLAIDQGTTSSRAIVFDLEGNIIDSKQKELQQHYPHNGWVEHDPMDILRDTMQCAEHLIDHHTAIKAIGITNQRETTIVWDKNSGKPVYNAIVWQDRRTSEYCYGLKNEGYEQSVQKKTGLLLDPYFSATKIHWILENVDGARKKAEAGELLFGTVETWLLWNLTKASVHASDITNAARTMLFNIHTQDWDDELLSLFNIPRTMLPEVHPNVYSYGEAFHGIPIAGMAGDQQAATIGQACFAKGMVKSTYGTGCFALFNTGTVAPLSKNRLLGTIAYDLGEGVHYAIEGSIFNAGTAIQWLRDGLGLIQHASETQALAESVPDNGGVYFVPAFTGLGAPYWQAEARGTLSGITRDTRKAHIIRAALEAQAYQTKDLLQAMAQDSGAAIKTLRVDGGMVKNDFVCQYLADILQITVERPKMVETTALGAAYCAGLGVGLYKDKETITAQWGLDKRFEPIMKSGDADNLYQGWMHAIHKTVQGL